MDSRLERIARTIGPAAFGALALYHFSVEMFHAPVPSSPWNKVLAIGLTLLFLPWLVLVALDWRRRHVGKPAR